MTREIRLYITLGWDCEMNKTSYTVSDTFYIPYDVADVLLYNSREKKRIKELIDRLRYSLDKGTSKHFSEDEVVCQHHKIIMPDDWVTNKPFEEQCKHWDIMCWEQLKKRLKYYED